MDMPRTASVTALVPTTLASCDRQTFDEFVRRCLRMTWLRPRLRPRVQPRTPSADAEDGISRCLPRAKFLSTEAGSGRFRPSGCSGAPASAPARVRPKLAQKGLDGAVRSLTRAKRERLVGPAPVDDEKHRIAPTDAWGHDHLWWLDRMVRTSRPLVERMTLVWHDWFATSNSGSARSG